MNLHETFSRLSEVSKNLAQKRGEVNQLWERWSDRVFLQMMAEKTSAELLIVRSGDEIHYFSIDMQARSLRPISQIYTIDGVISDAVGTDGQHEVIGDSSNECLQKDSSGSEESPSGSKEL